MVSQEVKRARVTAIVFGTLSSITLIAFVFAFIQQGVANKCEEIANQHAERALQCERLAIEMRLHAEQQRIEFQKKNDALQQELVELRNRRTK